MRDRALLGVAAHDVDAAVADADVPVALVDDGLRGAVPGAVAVPHGRAVGACRILGGQALAEAVAQLADHRCGHQGRIFHVGCGAVVGRVHCGGREGRAISVAGGGEDHHVPRGQATHVEREGRSALRIRARREVEGRRAAAVVVRADGEDRTGDLLAVLQVVGDGRVVEGQDLLGGVTPVLVVALAVVGAQVDQVQGRARVGRHGVRPDRVRGTVRRGRQAHAVRRNLDLALLARQVIAEEQVLVGGGDVVVVLHPRLQVRGHGAAGAHEELVVEHATVVAELQVVRAVRRERRVRELDGVRVKLTEGDAVDVDGRVILVGGHPVGDRVDAGRELDGLRHVLPRVVAARRVEVNVLDELLLPGLTHVEDHLVVGGIGVLPGVARRKRERTTLAGVDGEGDGGATRGEVARVGAARRGIVAGEDLGAAADACLVRLGLDTRPLVRSHARMDRLLRILRIGHRGRGVVVVRVGGNDLRLITRLVASALQVGRNLRVCLVVIPQFGVHVGSGIFVDLLASCTVGQVDAHLATDVLVRVVNEGCQTVGQVNGIAGGVLLGGLPERVDVRAVECECGLLLRVLPGDVGAPVLVVDVHHELVTLGLVHALGGRHPPLLAEVANPIGSVVLAQAPFVFDGARVIVVVGRVRHRVGE